MRASLFSVLWLSCLLAVAGCSAAPAARHTVTATSTTSPTATLATTPAETLAPNNSPWHQLWTLPALPPPPPGTYGADPPYLPQIAWSPANAQRLYLCRATLLYAEMPAVLHDLYRSDDQGLHWKAYALAGSGGELPHRSRPNQRRCAGASRRSLSLLCQPRRRPDLAAGARPSPME